jgi:hypothetical protein
MQRASLRLSLSRFVDAAKTDDRGEVRHMLKV